MGASGRKDPSNRNPGFPGASGRHCAGGLEHPQRGGAIALAYNSASLPTFHPPFRVLPIDVIIPVYRGLRETRRCIESVLAATCSTPNHIVVVDDSSPEPAISAWLDGLARDGRIELLRNTENVGFVKSVNRAMALHQDRDAVLLNSDTEVADGWLDRLAGCAERHADAASVCPFSNNATLASYPRIGEINSLPAGLTTA
ncbi:MAG: glycosyltransferase, partial [Betaproteobacteria bacterium]|nr:glycosyltransferase [Betaproteobacteria bacterium]